MYADVKNNIATALKSAERVAVTCDSWTSRATDSYLTITCHYIDGNWYLVSHVIQTRAIEARHTATHLAELLIEALREWELTDRVPAAVTDNAANIVRAVASMGLLHVDCFAHTLNLASQAALKIPSVARLMGRVRQIAAFFHRSTTVSHMLKEKQKLLNLCQHKLVIDVVTRWNSSLDMLECFLEQQPAITATLLSPEVHRNERDLCTLTEADVTLAEDIVKALQPLKTATLVMSEEMTPTLSVIAPMHARLLDQMTSVPDDSPVIKELKTAVHVNLSSRYEALKETLYEASALDPRFKTLPFLSQEACDDTFARLTTILTEAAHLEQVEASDEDNSLAADAADPPPTKRSKEPSSALMSLLGPAYKPKEPAVPVRSAAEKANDEVKGYREVEPLPLSANPLSWWMKHEESYPLLARQAKHYLCVPGTSVPSERAFSTVGDIITAKRSCLTPEHVDQLLFLQKNLTVPSK
ncbi:E3 SUMO-protein ligase ZBED1-like isoform X2 [Acanthochromis polyacanthus]|uniref:E3 SUMO-protein ligase ZBED1-like isoform X2 n=1 Tax=Acanthochromis polyacanthus TaxID=80966 RepID=UPI0022345DC5|nr:E3 SUMO-protein ligase ZBED1-like isoform X2 [Acanthochromis polyacanthus]